MSSNVTRANTSDLTVVQNAESGRNGDSAPATRVARAAAHTRRKASEVELLPFDLSALADGGIFINVDASGFTMLDRRLDWQSVGITLPVDTDLAFRPPRCGVLPNRYRRPLLAPAAKAHQALHKYSYQFRLVETLFETPSYRFVPTRAFPEFEREYECAVEDLRQAKQRVLDDYDAIRAEVLTTFTQLAEDSMRRLRATGVAVPGDFRERVTTSVLDALPSEHDLRDRLMINFRVGTMLLGSEMLREQRQAIEGRRAVERVSAEAEREQQVERMRTVRTQQELWLSQESAKQRLAAEREEHRREAELKERLRNLKLQAARERLQETLDPLIEGARALRAQIHESAQAMHAAWVKHGYLPGATVRKARNLAKWFKVMDMSSDESLRTLIAELERIASVPIGTKKKRGASGVQRGNVKAVLDDIIHLTYRDAVEIAAPNRISALEL